MRSFLRKFGRDEDGFSLVFVGMGGLALVGASMLAIDVGMLMSARSQAQNAADAGALAGAIALAYDDWDDRTADGPAVVRAIATAKANKVQDVEVAVNPADVVFLNDEAGVASRVQVTVYRDTAHQNAVQTLIAQYFKIATANVSAVAVAEASPANAMTCVKPFTIPDRWIEKNPITTPWTSAADFSRYDKKGNLISPADVYEPAYTDDGGKKVQNPNYSGYNSEKSRGEKLVLRASNASKIQSSFYFSLAMTDDTGGSDYEWNIANCNRKIYGWGSPLIQEPGAKEGPTIHGIQMLIDKDPNAVWNQSTKAVDNSAYGERQSPRVFPIPLYDPDYYDEGHQTGRVATLRTANWIGFFVEYIGSGSEIHGRIIPIGGIRDKTMTTGTNDFPRAIRLVK
jgi:Flp pilus assembly protein TadG